MRRHLLVVLCGLPLVAATLAVMAPADAASRSVSIATKNIGVSSSGKAQVRATCSSSKTCTGFVQFRGDKVSPGAPVFKPIPVSFSIPARGSKMINVAMNSNSPLNPNRPANNPADEGDIERISNIKLTVSEKSPRKVVHYYDVTADTQLPGGVQQLRGTVTGAPGSRPMDDDRVTVQMIDKVRGGNERLAASRDIRMTPSLGGYTGSYAFNIRVDSNNVPVMRYYLKIKGVDADGQERSWWWRGVNGTFWGGPRYSRDAASIIASKHKDYVADFEYGFVTGRVLAPAEFLPADRATGMPSFVKAGVDVVVASPPPSYYGSDVAAMRELDIERCANVFATTRTSSNGSYRADFLPTTARTDNRYLVGAHSGSVEVWTGGNNPRGERRFGSCHDATGYTYSRTNLITLTSSRSGIDLPLTTPTNVATITKPKPSFARVSGDSWVTLREKIPGVSILDSPVVRQGYGATSATAPGRFGLPQGRYWVETGRRTGCSAWYPSYFKDNKAYFNGLDRGAESWKTVNGAAAEYQKSYAMGYVKRTPPKGKKGWMYRNYCKTLSAGTYNSFFMRTDNVSPAISKAQRGGVVYGKVTRSGGRTNKEMHVRLSKSDGTAVVRTDLTDGSGRFYVAGLMPGRYTVTVNADSWRGIGRSFKGTHSITIKANQYRNAGTLKFSG